MLERTVKLLAVGATSITVHLPFKVGRVEDLVDYPDLQFADGSSLYDEVVKLAEDVRRELKPFYVRPVERRKRILNSSPLRLTCCCIAGASTSRKIVPSG